MLLNLNDPSKSQVPYDFFLFPDGQPHFRFDISSWCVNDILCSITSMNDIGKLATAVGALSLMPSGFSKSVNVHIPYLLGARQDKIIPGEALTVEVICNPINSILEDLDVNKVRVLHPHSDAPQFLINSYSPWDPIEYVEKAIKDFQPDFLIIPDLGAAKNAQNYDKFGLPQVQCTKRRDVKTGKLSGFDVLGDAPLEGRGMIVDDICDGGGTFVGIAGLFPNCELALYTTHGIYSKGLQGLNKVFSKLYCTNSYHYAGLPPEIQDHSLKLKMFEIEF